MEMRHRFIASYAKAHQWELSYKFCARASSTQHISSFSDSVRVLTKSAKQSSMATSSEKQVMIVAVDDSEHSGHALKWTLDHFFTPVPDPIFKLVLVHAKPPAASAVGLAGPGAAEVLPIVDADLRRTATKVIEKAKEMCIKKSVSDVIGEVVEGDPRNVLCEVVERLHASVLVVGSHGYGAIKRAVLGSVSDYCAHHAHCTVMIVKKPKTKH